MLHLYVNFKQRIKEIAIKSTPTIQISSQNKNHSQFDYYIVLINAFVFKMAQKRKQHLFRKTIV